MVLYLLTKIPLSQSRYKDERTRMSHPINISSTPKFNRDCSGMDCTNMATLKLKIRLINKTGFFCQQCSDHILRLNLAEIVT